jgi:UDP-N-acetylglucosamine--N-acetylmuramyl-(pentapeptide) pyrophosphoryl-undecaprenol N-acetylglucosamine transferase
MRPNGVDPHIVFAGGRTGGHLFPGLAVAELLAGELPSVRITFVGGGGEFERRHVARAGFEYLAVPCQPLPRRLRDFLPFVAANHNGYRQALGFLGSQRVSAVVGLGSYTSGPMARAAIRQNVPLVLLEQNAVPGRATRWLGPGAALVCTAFAAANRYLSPRCLVRVTGNPVRSGFCRGLVARDPAGAAGPGQTPLASANPSGGNGHDKLLLILGGSGGARSLNQNVPRALQKVGPALRGWQVAHQSGTSELEATRELYRKLDVRATVVPFVSNMPRVLARTDLAICRAGGTTLAELAATGVPAVLVPYPHATDDHQRKNADVFTSAGASLTLDERELPGRLDDHLAGAIALVVSNPALRAAMSESMRRLAHPDAAWDVATMVRQVAALRCTPPIEPFATASPEAVQHCLQASSGRWGRSVSSARPTD